MGELAHATTQLAASDLEALYAAYEAELDASPKTKATYTRSLKQWREYLAQTGTDEAHATRETVLAYRSHLTDQGKSSATVSGYLTAVRSLYSWLETKKLYPNIAAGIRGPKMGNNSPKDALTAEQAAELLSEQPDGLQGLRDYAMVNLMLRRGLRTIEVARANVGDLRQINGEAVLYVQGKGYTDKSDFVLLNGACLKPIYAYLEARGKASDEEALFAGIGNRNGGGRMTTRTISRIAKEALRSHGITSSHITAHSLRHTAVTFALLGGATVQEAQALARHASINTTMRYAHNLDKMKGAAESSVDGFIGEHMPNTQANTHLTAKIIEREHKENTEMKLSG